MTPRPNKEMQALFNEFRPYVDFSVHPVALRKDAPVGAKEAFKKWSAWCDELFDDFPVKS